MQQEDVPIKIASGPLPEAVVARRWGRSTRTLQRWRRAGYGPAWLRIGGSVFYLAEDIEAFEQQVRQQGRRPA